MPVRPGTKKQGFQAKLLSEVLRTNPEADKERALGCISARSPSLTSLSVRKSSARARPMLNGSERAENALKEVLSARSLGKRGKADVSSEQTGALQAMSGGSLSRKGTFQWGQ